MYSIKVIRNYLRSKIGSKIVIIYYGSRKKREVYRGILENTYVNIFVVRLGSGCVKSFNYFDILTKTVKICI